MNGEERCGFAGALTGDHCTWCCQEDLDIGPSRRVFRIPEIKADHVIESRPASTAYLPQSGDAWFGLQHSSVVPRLVLLHFVMKRRTWAHERHLSTKHIPELRQLVEACLPEHMADWRDSGIIHDLERRVLRTAAGRCDALDHLADELFVHRRIVVHVDRAELEHLARSTLLANARLPKEHGAWRLQLHQRRDQREHR